MLLRKSESGSNCAKSESNEEKIYYKTTLMNMKFLEIFNKKII